MIFESDFIPRQYKEILVINVDIIPSFQAE